MNSSQSSMSKGSREVRQVKCECNLECILYTSQKEKSVGKKFLRCPRNRTNDDCGYFYWLVDDDTVTGDKGQHLRILQEKILSVLKKASQDMERISKEQSAITTHNKIMLAILTTCSDR